MRIRTHKPAKSWIQRHETRLRRTSGCLTDCVAYVLNKHPENVPYFIYPRRGWQARFKAWWRRRGYKARWVLCNKVPQKGTHIICGDSVERKNYGHAVVYRNGRLAYDPSYPSGWLQRHITHRLLLLPLGTKDIDE